MVHAGAAFAGASLHSGAKTICKIKSVPGGIPAFRIYDSKKCIEQMLVGKIDQHAEVLALEDHHAAECNGRSPALLYGLLNIFHVCGAAMCNDRYMGGFRYLAYQVEVKAFPGA